MTTPRLLLALLLTLPTLAQAQSTPPKRGSSAPTASTAPAPTQPPRDPAKRPNYNPSPIELSTEPWKFDSVGLTMILPVDSIAQVNAAAGKASAQIIPKDASWLINVQTPKTSNPDATCEEICDAIVTEHFKAAGELMVKPSESTTGKAETVGVRGKLLDLRKTMKIGGLDAQRVYFSVPGQKINDPAVVRGLTVFSTGPGQFTILELVTTSQQYERTRPIYEATVATATFEDPSTLIVKRASAVTATRKVLDALTPEDLRAIIAANPERWERWYKPASTGADADAKELGYRRIVMMYGPRSSMVQGRSSISRGDNAEGFIIQMDARTLDNGFVIDSSAAYFLSPDKADESWTIRNAMRKGGKTDTVTERGARNAMSLVVQIEGAGMTPKEIRPIFQSDGYISRVEATILPQLLMKSGAAAEYGSYTYQSDESTVCFRRDLLEQPPESPGLWKLTTRLSDKKPALTTLYNAKGELLRTEMPDGSLWEPVKADKLMQLWTSKGLPVEKARK